MTVVAKCMYTVRLKDLVLVTVVVVTIAQKYVLFRTEKVHVHRGKRRDLTQSYDKYPYSDRKIQKAT